MNSLERHHRNQEVETAMDLQVHAREYARLRTFGGEVAERRAQQLRLSMMRDVLALQPAKDRPRAA